MARVLLVEDDRYVRMLVEHVLIRDRYEVDAVDTIEAGLALLDRGIPYDLVLTDAVLSDERGDGLQLAEQAGRLGTPVIVMTGYGLLLPSQRLAPFELLLKPVRPAELLEAIERVLERESANPSIPSRR